MALRLRVGTRVSVLARTRLVASVVARTVHSRATVRRTGPVRAVCRSAPCALQSRSMRAAPSSIPVSGNVHLLHLSGVRSFADAPEFLNPAEVEQRVIDTLKEFPKVDAAAVTSSSHFTKDLGLDSLDVVELVMAMEDEFGVEISDAEAEKIHSVKEAISFFAGHPGVK